MSIEKVRRRARTAVDDVRQGYAVFAKSTIDFVPQPLGRHIDPGGLGGYYCDLRHKARETVHRIEVEGPQSPYAWSIPIAQAALGFWDLRIEGQSVEREFLKLADWFVENCDEGAGGAVWRSHVAVPKYGLEPGWISAMGQGQAISVLLRAAQLSGEGCYSEIADAALGSLLMPVSAGGTQGSLDGVPVLEEYPTVNPSAVLNGWVFALWGVYELATVTGNEPARELFEASSAGLLRLLPRYDIGWWTLYSLYDHGRPDLAKPFYQDLHPVMLEGLELIRPDSRLRHYADRWRAQRTRLNTARAAADKLFFRVYREIR